MRQELAGSIDQVLNAGERGALIEAGILFSRANQHGAVLPGDDVAALAPEDAPEPLTLPSQVQQLTANRPHRERMGDTVDLDIADPAARRNHNTVASRRLHARVRNMTQQLIAVAGHTRHATAVHELGAAPPGSRLECSRELCCGDKAVTRNKQP